MIGKCPDVICVFEENNFSNNVENGLEWEKHNPFRYCSSSDKRLSVLVRWTH